jgi:hypothetical protein
MASTGQTGTSDVTYNLISVAYHALQGAETHEQFARDAEGQGDQDAAAFFRQAQQQLAQVAQQAKQLMADRLQGAGGGAGMHAGAMGGGMAGAQAAVMGHAGSKPGAGGQGDIDVNSSVTEGTDTTMAAGGSSGSAAPGAGSTGAGAAEDVIANQGKVG